MDGPYREPLVDSSESTLSFYLFPLWMRISWVCFAFMQSMWLIVVPALDQDLTVDCSHASAECTVSTRYPPLAPRNVTVPLSSIRGTRLRWSIPGRRRPEVPLPGDKVREVTLQTVQGDLDITAYREEDRIEEKAALDAFLSHKDAPPIHIVCNTSTLLWPVPVVLYAALLVFVRWVLRRNSVTFRWIEGKLIVARSGWGRRPSLETVPIAEVVGVRVQEDPVPYRRRSRVALQMRSGAAIALTPFYRRSLLLPLHVGIQERIARDVEAALARR